MFGEVKGVGRIAGTIDADGVQVIQLPRHGVRSVHVVAQVAPRGNDEISVPSQFSQPSVILRSHWLRGGKEVVGVGGAVGKQVGHAQAGIAPIACKAHAAADSRVILAVVGCRRVETDQQHEIIAFAPLTPQGITVLAAPGKIGSALQVGVVMGHGRVL